MRVLLVVISIVVMTPVYSQRIRQCLCSEIRNCKSSLLNSVKPCADRCQRYAAGVNYGRLRNCILQRQPEIRRTISCVEGSFANSCASRPGRFVQKRYLESLELAGVNEIRRMLARSGVSIQPERSISTGRRYFRCVKSCVERTAFTCTRRLNCGLNLPSDSVVIQVSKQCAVRSGLNTPVVRQLCNCAVNAGVRQLQNVCPRLQII